VLAQGRHGLVAHHHRVEGVDAALGHGGRVGGLPPVADLQLRHRDAGHAHQVDARRVHHQRGVDAVEGALSRHELLAAAVLLGGRAQHPHPAPQLVRHRRQGQPRADARGRDQVVPAGVAHLRQGVVLGQQRHTGAAVGAELRGECRLEAVDTGFDLEARPAERRREQRCRLVLLEGQLGIGVNGAGDPQQLVAHAVDRLADPVLEISCLHAPILTVTASV
jgi:hypothetical protein